MFLHTQNVHVFLKLTITTFWAIEGVAQGANSDDLTKQASDI